MPEHHANTLPILSEEIPLSDAVEQALVVGDLAKLSPELRVQYYHAVCLSIGLNPLTRPFGFYKDDGGITTMYARKECAEQLRHKYRVSVKETGREWMEDQMLAIRVTASMPDGREEDEMGVVYLAGKDGKPYTGQYRANMIMKCLTKAKRRATLSLIGLGFAQADEVAQESHVNFDPTTGEILDATPPALPAMGARTPTDTEHAATRADIAGDRDDTLEALRDRVGVLRAQIVAACQNYERTPGELTGRRPAWIAWQFPAETGLKTMGEESLKTVLEHLHTEQEHAFPAAPDSLEPASDPDADWQAEHAAAEAAGQESLPGTESDAATQQTEARY